MSKKNNIIIILALVAVTVVVIIIAKSFSIRSVNPDGMTAIEEEPVVDMAELAQAYRASLDVIMPRYLALWQSGERGAIAAVRAELLALTMPPDYREAHARLVLLLDAMEDGTPSTELRDSFNELAAAYGWLAKYTADVQ